MVRQFHLPFSFSGSRSRELLEEETALTLAYLAAKPAIDDEAREGPTRLDGAAVPLAFQLFGIGLNGFFLHDGDEFVVGTVLLTRDARLHHSLGYRILVAIELAAVDPGHLRAPVEAGAFRALPVGKGSESDEGNNGGES